jgi:hypothetical protein
MTRDKTCSVSASASRTPFVSRVASDQTTGNIAS